MADERRFSHPPKRLAAKVRKKGGPTAEQAILRALNAAEDLMDHYQGWAVDDLTKLWKAYEGSRSAATDSESIAEMFEIAHGVRGEGGSFGFQLISTAGDSLCKFLEDRATLNTAELEVVKVHILTMRAVFRQNLKGPQPTINRELQQLLALLRKRMSG